MKKCSFLILLCASLLNSYAQKATIDLEIVGGNDKKVNLITPLNGEKFWGNKSSQDLDAQNHLSLSFEVKKIGYLQLVNSGSFFKFYIEPGKNTIKLDLTKKGADQIAFMGASAAGQILLNSKSRNFYQSNAEAYYRKDSTAAGITALIDSNNIKALKPYQQLLAEQKISPAFYDYVKTDIDQYYTSVLTFVPISVYFDSMRKRSYTLRSDLDGLWEKAYKDHPVDDLRYSNADNFYDQAKYYALYYKNDYLLRKNGIEPPKAAAASDYLKNQYETLKSSFTGKMQEYMLANYIHNEMLQEKFQPVLMELYNDFKKMHPKSMYLAPLLPGYQKIAAYQNDIKQDFSTDQKLMANADQINSLDELAARFKGKTVFVDIWATWCGPCKQEFQYGKELEAFLKSKGAEMLFISMDKDAVDAQWKEMIKYYKLSGSHIRTNAGLQKDLIDRLWDGKGYSIPRYLILKDGKMTVNDALRPSDKNKLYEQIAAQL